MSCHCHGHQHNHEEEPKGFLNKYAGAIVWTVLCTAVAGYSLYNVSTTQISPPENAKPKYTDQSTTQGRSSNPFDIDFKSSALEHALNRSNN